MKMIKAIFHVALSAENNLVKFRSVIIGKIALSPFTLNLIIIE